MDYISKICPNCKAEIKEADAVKVCPSCGNSIEEQPKVDASEVAQGTNPQADCVSADQEPQAAEQALSEPTAESVDNAEEEMPAKRFCTGCGAELQPGQKFCTSCGKSLEADLESNTIAVEEFNRQLVEKKKKKKKRILLILAAIVASIALVIGGKFAFTSIRHSIGISKAEKAVAGYKADEIDYDTAIATLTALKASKDPDVATNAVSAEKTVEKLKVSKDHFKKGELYKGKKEYQNAVTHYEAVIKEDPNYEKAQAAINEIIPLWKEVIPAEVDKLLKAGKTDDAQTLVKTFTGYSDDESIAAIGQFIEAEDYYQKGYLNSAKDIYQKLPATLKVNGITVKSRLDTLKKYDFFVKMCGDWDVTKHYMETKEVWRSGRWNSWYYNGTTDSNMYLRVTCVINKDGTVTVSGEVKYDMYTNYSSISSYVHSKYFTSSFEKKVSIPTDGKVSFDFSEGGFTRGDYQRVKDNQKISFDGSSFKHSISIKYVYSHTNTEYYSSNETFGKRAEKY